MASMRSAPKGMVTQPAGELQGSALQGRNRSEGLIINQFGVAAVAIEQPAVIAVEADRFVDQIVVVEIAAQAGPFGASNK